MNKMLLISYNRKMALRRSLAFVMITTAVIISNNKIHYPQAAFLSNSPQSSFLQYQRSILTNNDDDTTIKKNNAIVNNIFSSTKAVAAAVTTTTRQDQRRRRPLYVLSQSTTESSSNDEKERPSNKNNNNKKNTKNTKKKVSSYEQWLIDTLEWVEKTPVGSLPFEIFDDAHEMMRGWVGDSMSTRRRSPKKGGGRGHGRGDDGRIVKSLSVEECAVNAEKLLMRFIEENEAKNKYANRMPTVKMYQMAMEGWAKCAYKQTTPKHRQQSPSPAPLQHNPGKRSHALLTLMDKRYSDPTIPNAAKPNVACYNIVIQALSWNRDTSTADTILQKLESTFDDAMTTATTAESKLDRLSYKFLKPITSMYNTVISSYLRYSTYPQNARQISSILSRLEHQFLHLNNTFAKPTSFSYTTLISLYASHRRCEEAESILRRLEQMYLRCHRDRKLAPDTIVYNTIMSGWANSRNETAGGPRAQALLDEMVQGECANPHIRPNLKSMHAVILAWAKCGRAGGTSQNPDGGYAASMARKALDDMTRRYEDGEEEMKPDVRTYTSVINAYGRSGARGAAANATMLLEMMEREYERTGEESCRPNTITYTAVLDALAFDKYYDDDIDGNDGEESSPCAAREAERILNRMIELAASGRNTAVEPDVRSYNAVLNAWSKNKSPDAGENAERLLMELERRRDSRSDDDDEATTVLEPDAFSYNAVISAYARRRENDGYDAAQKAEDVLKRMEDNWKLAKNSEESTSTTTRKRSVVPRPITNNYNAVMSAWAAQSGMTNGGSERSVIYEKCRALLETMEHEYEQKGDGKMEPDKYSYSSVLYALARSDYPDKATIAYEYLQKMKTMANDPQRKQDCYPDAQMYSSVLNACAYTRLSSSSDKEEEQLQKETLFRIAKDTFKEMQDEGNRVVMTDAIYNAFLKCCDRFLPSGDDTAEKLIEAVFVKCCQSGMVSLKIVREMELMAGGGNNRAVTKSLLKTLFGEYCKESEDGVVSVPYDKLPQEWTCRVVQNKGKQSR